MAKYDILGNIAIVKFKRKTPLIKKKKFASALLKERRQLTTILEKTEKFKGRLRLQKTKFISGIKTKEALYRENNCIFRLNVDSCYFSPRLASERKEIASFVKKGEKVLVLFGGVAPFAIVIAKLSKPEKVISVELNRECNKYALDNVKRNKLNNVQIIKGDIKKISFLMYRKKERFNRIIMARPNLKDSFLKFAFPLIKKNGIIHYYGFCNEDSFEAEKFMLLLEAKMLKKKIKITNFKKAGNIGIRKYRYRADVKVLN